MRHDYNEFKGDLKFVRDEDAQKDFSKLREAIGASIYKWRAHHTTSPQYRARMEKEAEFAFKQAFAYCPYSEAAFHYIQLLLDSNRLGDALLVAETFLKLDPFNGQVQDMVRQLRAFNNAQPASLSLDKVFAQVQQYARNNQTKAAADLLEQVEAHPAVTPTILMTVADDYTQLLHDYPKAEEALKKATQLEPSSSFPWYSRPVCRFSMAKTATRLPHSSGPWRTTTPNVWPTPICPTCAWMCAPTETSIRSGNCPSFRLCSRRREVDSRASTAAAVRAE